MTLDPSTQSHASPAGNPSAATLEEAAIWFATIREESVSDGDLLRWRQWLASDPRNCDAFDGIVAMWKASDNLSDLPWPSDAELAIDDYEGQAALPTHVGPLKNHRRWVLAAAAAAAAVAAMIVPAGLQVMEGSQSEPNQKFLTSIGEHKRLTLDDGSIVELGANSQLNVKISDTARQLSLLSGEAFFTVAKDPSRPFTVAAGSGGVVAIGTAFNVKIGAGKVTVSVLEGRVRVLPDLAMNIESVGRDIEVEETRDLLTGQDIQFDETGNISRIANVDVGLATSWRQGRLSFVDKPLDLVIADVNRYSAKTIRLGDNATAGLRFTGTVFPDSVPDWIEGLQRALPLRVIELGSAEIILLANERNGSGSVK
ncbi:MAG: DUF4880 domain-containing protein [Alphaproteobacteria bacterium]|nr:DUF4880 domain-containing protein [Alphaproteobacteria bacterium]